MAKTSFVCPDCENNFEIELIPIEVARERKINTKPVTCPNCGSGNVFDPSK